jgi:hypothetical protein
MAANARLVWFLSIVIATAVSQGCSGKGCFAVGCVAAATIQADLTATIENLRNAEITICRNDQCLSRSMSALGEPRDGTGTGLMLPEDVSTIDRTMSPHADVTVWSYPNGALWMDVKWTTWAQRDPRNGDRYRVTITDQAGGSILSLTETVASYAENYPAGKDCNPEPCRHVTLDRRARAGTP